MATEETRGAADEDRHLPGRGRFVKPSLERRRVQLGRKVDEPYLPIL